MYAFSSFSLEVRGIYFNFLIDVEVDFPEICYKKAAVIRSNSILRAAIGNEISNPQKCAGEIHSMQYHLAPVDLRDTNQLGKALESSKVDFSQPIFYLSECVLVYMNPNDSAVIFFSFFLNLLNHFTKLIDLARDQLGCPKSKCGRRWCRIRHI